MIAPSAPTELPAKTITLFLPLTHRIISLSGAHVAHDAYALAPEMTVMQIPLRSSSHRPALGDRASASNYTVSHVPSPLSTEPVLCAIHVQNAYHYIETAILAAGFIAWLLNLQQSAHAQVLLTASGKCVMVDQTGDAKNQNLIICATY